MARGSALSEAGGERLGGLSGFFPPAGDQIGGRQEDGVEALKRLGDTAFDLAIIDLDLPRLSGVEVVEAIRAAEQTRDLPIVILSQERRESVIRTLMALGVSAYLLKPLRERAVLGRIAPLLAMRRPSQSLTDAASDTRLTPDSPALLVDGDANFCHAFTSVASGFGPVMTADSGADALALFRKSPTGLVFIGTGLGIVGTETLVKKLRDAASSGVRLVGVGAVDNPAQRRLFDDVMPRAFVPQVLTDALRPFVFVPGPLSRLEQVAPRFSECLTSAVVQVFGMMGGVDAVVSAEPTHEDGDGVVASVGVDVDGRYTLDVRVALSRPVLRDFSQRLLGEDGRAVDGDAEISTAAEIANMITGRLYAWLRGRSLASQCTLPETRPAEADDWTAAIAPAEGSSSWFTVPDVAQGFRLSWVARENGAA